MDNDQNKQQMTYDDYKNSQNRPKKKVSTGLIVFIVILASIVLISVSCNSMMKSLFEMGEESVPGTIDYSSDYVAVLSVDGTIAEAESSVFETVSYNHEYTINAINDLINDSDNKALVLQVNSPGGSVYASDELYLAILAYKETGRPVYSAMGSMAASGGYYISAPCDKIIANRNCWTGSIGVRLGTVYDITGLLEKMGIESETITSGENKAMGDYNNELTEEQIEIYQSLVGEAYEQFVGIVADGRNMDIDEVKKLADGRVYTAKQAYENGLVDEIGDYNYAISTLISDYSLNNCNVIYLEPEQETDLFSLLTESILFNGNNVSAEYKEIMDMVSNSDNFTVTYMSNVSK